MGTSSRAPRGRADADPDFHIKLENIPEPESPLDATCQEIDEWIASPEDSGSAIRHRGSLVHEYFVCRRTCAICKLCKKSLKRSGGNTSNLFQHLKRVHRKQHAAMMEEKRRRKIQAAAGDVVC